MNKMDALELTTYLELLDNALAIALEMPATTPMERYQRTVSVTNVKGMYSDLGTIWPALDAVQRKAFDECHAEALALGLER